LEKTATIRDAEDPGPHLSRRILARVERILHAGRSLELTRGELVELLYAAVELRDLDERVFEDSDQAYLPHHVATIKEIAEVILAQLTSKFIPLPLLEDSGEEGQVQPRQIEKYRQSLAQHVRLAPMLLSQKNRHILASAIEKLNDGSRESPTLFRPLEINKKQKLPRDAAALEPILACWVDWEIGRGVPSEAAVELVSKAVGWGVKSVQAWRTKARKSEHNRSLMAYAFEKGQQGAPLFDNGVSLQQICIAYKAVATPRTLRHFDSAKPSKPKKEGNSSAS
jgi:hypothetical protein